MCNNERKIIPASRWEQIGTGEAFPAWYVASNIINQTKDMEVIKEY